MGEIPNEPTKTDDAETPNSNVVSVAYGVNSGSRTDLTGERLGLRPWDSAQSDQLFRTAGTTNETGQAFLLLPGGLAYEGNVRDGQPNGQGTMTSPNGTHQWGEFRNGLSYKLNGTWIGADGTREEGTWNLDGTKSGGAITWGDGRVYKGDWKIVEGAPEQADGTGTMTWPDGRVYVGEFRDGKMEGQGKMTYPGGRIEEGVWRQDHFVGPPQP